MKDMTFFETIAHLWEQYRDLVIKVAMISLAAVTTTFVYLFQRPIMPEGWEGDLVAGASAVSLVLIYVGLAVAKLDAGRRKKVMWVAVAAALIEMLYGTIYVAAEIYAKNHPGAAGLFDQLPDYAAWGLGFLHAAPFSVLLFLVAQFVFHDPSKDENILKQMRDALRDLAEQRTKVKDLEQALVVNDGTITQLHADNQLLQQIRENDAASNARNMQALRDQILLLEAHVTELEDEKREYIAIIEGSSNSNTSNTTNGKGSYTDQITVLLAESPDLTNQEIYEMTGIPLGTIKVTAKRVRDRMAKTSVLN